MKKFSTVKHYVNKKVVAVNAAIKLLRRDHILMVHLVSVFNTFKKTYSSKFTYELLY